MDYVALNKIHKDRMQQISVHSYTMEWENPEFMDYLMGELPEITRYHKDIDIASEISSLDQVLATYNAFLTDKANFLSEIESKIADIQNKHESWYGLSIYEIEKYLKLHRFCLIYGEGGIGKSYFIKCFEERLEQKNIAHLCLYGKFEKDVSRIDVDEIIRASDEGFVFVYDAINEMSEEGQQSLLDVLTFLKKYPKIRIVITYRTNSMDEMLLKTYQEKSEYEYKFFGVSFESALTEILKMSVPDVYLYEDILYSNNALLLSMLCYLLAHEKIVDEKENGVASITFILEQYIKKTIGKVFKDNLTCQGKDIWEDTKRVAEWMYKNGEIKIDEKSLLSVIKTGDNFLPSMLQMGFMDGYEHDNEKYYYFVIDSLTDFLIARSLLEDISGIEFDEQVNVIKSKVDSLNNLKEAFIIAIFDKLSPDYENIKKLLEDTKLIEYLDIDILIKVHFKKADIKTFQGMFVPVDHSELLMTMGGYTDKPFNCGNYLFEYYCAKSERVADLSNILSGYHFQNGIKNRLKNVLYFTTLNDRADRRDDEAFYFALLCCAAPNRDVRCLAMKLLYEVVSKNSGYINKLISEYYKLLDFYTQEAVIYVLSQLKQNNEKIMEFYNRIISAQDNLTSKCVRRISIYLGMPYSYINWNRKNLFSYNENAAISDYLSDILFGVDLMNKGFLPFRYWGKNHIDMHMRFLINDKQEIEKINDYLREKYSCVCGGDCSGNMTFERRIMQEIKPITEIQVMDMKSFMESFENVFKYVFDYYGISVNRKSLNIHAEEFSHSVYMKCVDIATGLYYGSLMCNYYTNQFATYNSNQNNIGYELFDPLEYGEEFIITAPIPTYQDFIERLGDYVISSLEMPLSRDIYWVRDVELTKRNVLHLLEPIKVKKQEWIMLAGRVSLHEEDKHYIRWRDTYNIWCCSSIKETISDDGNARYLTIELDEYIGELKSYSENTIKPWLCKKIKDIKGQTDVFDETSLVLPPSEMIKLLNLNLNVSDLSWETPDKEKVIVCNNNKNSYYKDPIGGTVFIRKDFYDKFLEEHTIKYFAFAERLIPETGYEKETSLHFEIIDGSIEKEIKNDGGPGGCNGGYNPICTACPHTDITEDGLDDSTSLDMNLLKKMLNEYGIDDDITMSGD